MTNCAPSSLRGTCVQVSRSSSTGSLISSLRTTGLLACADLHTALHRNIYMSACMRFFHRHRRPWIPRTMNLASCNLTCHRKREHQNFTKKSVAGRLPTYFFHYMRKNTLRQISLLPGALYPVAQSHPLGATIEMREPRGARSRAGGTSPAGGVDKGVKKMFRNILRAHESV